MVVSEQPRPGWSLFAGPCEGEATLLAKCETAVTESISLNNAATCNGCAPRSRRKASTTEAWPHTIERAVHIDAGDGQGLSPVFRLLEEG